LIKLVAMFLASSDWFVNNSLDFKS